MVSRKNAKKHEGFGVRSRARSKVFPKGSLVQRRGAALVPLGRGKAELFSRRRKIIDIEFIPFEKLDSMNFKERVSYIISVVKQGKILVIDGRLSAKEESELIAETMKNIGGEFTGIELSSLSLEEEISTTIKDKVRKTLFKILTGRGRGLTVIGPARVIKDIKRDPDKLSILMH